MSGLADQFRTIVSKEKDPRKKKEAEPDIAYPTGFLAFDFLNGLKVYYKEKDSDNYKSYNSIGIVDGSMVTIIGRSGCGKTTFAMQVAGNIIKKYDTSSIFHDDIEGGIVLTRKQQLLDLYGEEFESRYISRNTGITAENFYERIKTIHDIKNMNRAEYEYNTGEVNSKGEPIIKLEPTVYILDSLALLMPEKYVDEEDLSGQMAATAAAKTNSAIFKRIIPMLKNANIILMVINHITESVEINQFARKQGQLAFLKPGETLGGGRVAVYVTNLLIRLDDHSKLKEEEAYGIDGIKVTVTLYKSRTTHAGNSITLILDYMNGFDKELSLFDLLKDHKRVGGAGAYLYFNCRPDLKFSQRQLKKKLEENPELQKAFATESFAVLQELIYDPGVPEDRIKKSYDINDLILGELVA